MGTVVRNRNEIHKPLKMDDEQISSVSNVIAEKFGHENNKTFEDKKTVKFSHLEADYDTQVNLWGIQTVSKLNSFVVVLHLFLVRRLETHLASLQAWYLDDGTIIGDTLVVRKVLELIMKDGLRCSLHLKVDKTKRIVTASGHGYGDWKWRLATLPFAFDRLGSKLLRHSGTVAFGPTFDDALFVFNTKMETGLLINLSEIDAPKLMKKLADIYFTRITQTTESTYSLSHRQMDLWQSKIEDHTFDWLKVVSISSLGHTMNEISIGKEVDTRLGGGRDKTLCAADMLLYSWDRGLDVCVDLKGSSHLTQTGMVVFLSGHAVIDATHRERVKYEAKCVDIRYSFLPLLFSSLGELEKDSVALVKRIQKFSVDQDIGPCVDVQNFNKISFVIDKRWVLRWWCKWFTKTSLITYLHDRHCSGEAQAITKHSLLIDFIIFERVVLTLKLMGLWLCGVSFRMHTLWSKCRHGNGSDFVSPTDGGDGVVQFILYDLTKPRVPFCFEQLVHVNDGVYDLKGLRCQIYPPKCHLGFSCVLKGAPDKVICKPDDISCWEESIVNAIRSSGMSCGSLQLLRETLSESSPTLSDVDDEDLDLDRIKSIPYSTSYGRDGLHAQHLMDCSSGAVRRLVSNVSAIMIGHSLDGYLDGLQVDVGVSGESKAIIHVKNRLIEGFEDDVGLSMLLVDFKNAFNLVDRELLKETLAESSPTLLYVDDEDLDLGERSIKKCKRKICDGHYTAEVRVLSSSSVAPYSDDTLEDLKTHPFQPTPSLPHIPLEHHHLIASSTMVLERIKSMPCGTYCGWDGLRAQYIIDCSSGAVV
ncbi:hypothetical protein Tco_1183472 [Tanacetum coccineum]